MSQFKDKDIESILRKEASREDVEKAVKRSDEVLRKVEGGFLQSEFSKIKLLVMMLRDYMNGVYTKTPWRVVGMIALTILYILVPLDLIVDFIPFAGQVDDLTILMLLWRLTFADIKRYALWKVEQGDKEVAELYERAFRS